MKQWFRYDLPFKAPKDRPSMMLDSDTPVISVPTRFTSPLARNRFIVSNLLDANIDRKL
jgi:hypothetical protein